MMIYCSNYIIHFQLEKDYSSGWPWTSEDCWLSYVLTHIPCQLLIYLYKNFMPQINLAEILPKMVLKNKSLEGVLIKVLLLN
jgi:hypothetical protein